MKCEYCDTEHPKEEIASPHYCIARLQEALEGKEAELAEVTEREGKVCPEDVPFDEYIRVLERKLAEKERLSDAFFEVVWGYAKLLAENTALKERVKELEK
jgi:hypothetical protein